MKLKVTIEPGEDSGLVAHVPALRGCHSQGRTHEEAVTNIREAIEAWLGVEQDKPDRTSQNSLDIELAAV